MNLATQAIVHHIQGHPDMCSYTWAKLAMAFSLRSTLSLRLNSLLGVFDRNLEASTTAFRHGETEQCSWLLSMHSPLYNMKFLAEVTSVFGPMNRECHGFSEPPWHFHMRKEWYQSMIPTSHCCHALLGQEPETVVDRNQPALWSLLSSPRGLRSFICPCGCHCKTHTIMEAAMLVVRSVAWSSVSALQANTWPVTTSV